MLRENWKYFRFEVLSTEIKEANKISSKSRLDCTGFYGQYLAMKHFESSKGHLCLYLSPSREIVKANSKRRTTWTLTNVLNFSSIYIEDYDFPQFGYGYPNGNEYVSAKKNPNPMFHFKNDAYLFIVNSDYTVIEVLVVPNGKNHIESLYQKLIDGDFDVFINNVRNKTTPYFEYKRAS